MNLSEVLKFQFRDADESSDWSTTFDATRGREVITAWNTDLLGPQPSESTIDSWYVPASRFYKRRELRRAHNEAYRNLFDLDGTFMEGERDFAVRQEGKGVRTAGDGTQVGSVLQAMDNLRTRLQNRLDQANDTAKTTVAAIESVTW